MTADIQKALHDVPFFARLTSDELRRVAEIGNEHIYPTGAHLFREGDEGAALFVLLSGEVQIYRTLYPERRAALAELGAGAYFGEMAIIDGGARSASALALRDCRAFLLDRKDFLALVVRTPGLLADLLRGFSNKIRSSNEQLLTAMVKEERARAQAELDRHRSIAEMVAGVAHEINTPLGIIHSAATFMTDTLRPAELAHLAKDKDALAKIRDAFEACQLIQSNIVRANALVASFKNLSVRQITDQLEPVRLDELTQEIGAMFRIKAKGSGIRLRIEVAEGVVDWLWQGFPGHLSQILLNLLTNIERYAYPDGEGGPAWIRLAERPDRRHFEVEVADAGAGIPEADLPRVFDAFFTTGRDRGGTGLGLSIVHNLVTSSLRGTIDLHSEPGTGTRVTFGFPKDLARVPAVSAERA